LKIPTTPLGSSLVLSSILTYTDFSLRPRFGLKYGPNRRHKPKVKFGLDFGLIRPHVDLRLLASTKVLAKLDVTHCSQVHICINYTVIMTVIITHIRCTVAYLTCHAPWC